MLIDKNLFLMDVTAENETDLIAKMADQVYQQGYITSVDEYVCAVLAREKEFSTAFGYGVAIPHGETDVVTSTFLSFCKPLHEVLWGPKKMPVSLVFMIGVPVNQKANIHLKILADLSRHLLDDAFRKKISDSKTREEIYELLLSIEKGIKIS